MEIKRIENLETGFLILLEEATEVILFVLIIRYLKEIDQNSLEDFDSIADEMGHIEVIRTFFGGPKNN